MNTENINNNNAINAINAPPKNPYHKKVTLFPTPTGHHHQKKDRAFLPDQGTTGIATDLKTSVEVYSAHGDMLYTIPIADVISFPPGTKPNEVDRKITLCPYYEHNHNHKNKSNNNNNNRRSTATPSTILPRRSVASAIISSIEESSTIRGSVVADNCSAFTGAAELVRFGPGNSFGVLHNRCACHGFNLIVGLLVRHYAPVAVGFAIAKHFCSVIHVPRVAKELGLERFNETRWSSLHNVISKVRKAQSSDTLRISNLQFAATSAEMRALRVA